jgi:hypothetical protein
MYDRKRRLENIKEEIMLIIARGGKAVHVTVEC